MAWQKKKKKNACDKSLFSLPRKLGEHKKGVRTTTLVLGWRWGGLGPALPVIYDFSLPLPESLRLVRALEKSSLRLSLQLIKVYDSLALDQSKDRG